MFVRVLACALVISLSSSIRAQDAFSGTLRPRDDQYAGDARPAAATAGISTVQDEVVPQSAWLDFRQHADALASRQSAPAWVQAITVSPVAEGASGAAKTVFRIQLAHPPGDYPLLFFRLFFDDRSDARPELLAWDESGTQVLRSGELGAGIDLPSSDAALIPMNGISLIDVEVPGDGKTVRGAYVDWMKSREAVQPVNAQDRHVLAEEFTAMPPLQTPADDTEKFGTITATLSAETIRLGAQLEGGAAFQFGVESQPLLALLTFEVASPPIDAPPEIYLNGQDIGPATLVLPELADPAYRGEMEALVNQMHFRYTGWLRAQKVVPVANLKAGDNQLIIANGAGTAASAIRATQIQLKYFWEKSDYILRPTR